MDTIRIIVCGVAGKMGRSIIKNIAAAPDLKLTGAVDLIKTGEDAGELAGIQPLGLTITNRLQELMATGNADVMVDFTSPLTVMDNIHCALQHRVVPVVGTTGISEEELKTVRQWVSRYGTGAIVAPNFAIGAVLMMKAAQMCARYMKAVEIIEMHHDEKLDAPSGTACKTALLIHDAAGQMQPAREELEKVPGVRGGRIAHIPVHSIRLPGLMAHQEVVFGGEGQMLTIRHDAINRDCFIPGLLMAIRHAHGNTELIYGMENLLDF